MPLPPAPPALPPALPPLSKSPRGEAKGHRDPLDVPVWTSPSVQASEITWVPPSPDLVRGYSGFVSQSKPAVLRTSPYFDAIGVVPPTGYTITTGNDASLTFNATVRSRLLRWDVPDSVRAFGIGFVVSLLGGGLTNPVPTGSIEMTNSGASGKGYDCCRTKQIALTNHWSEVCDYVQNYRRHEPPIFTYMHKKGEILPTFKADNQTRPIVYPPTHFYVLQKVHTQELDKRMKESRTWFSYGKSVLRGHFNEIAYSLQTYRHLFKGDCTKFDSSIGPSAFSVIRDIRKALSSTRSHDALDFVYDVLSSKLVQYPTTHLIFDDRQPSGQACTTSDNSLFHAFVISASYALHFETINGRLPTIGEVHDKLCVYLYSDDHIGATTDSAFSTFACRSALYARFGCTLKADDDQSGGNLQDYVYLGGSFVRHPHLRQFYVYHYIDELIFDLLPLTTARHTQAEIAQTLCSLAQLIATSEEKYNKVHQLVGALRSLPGWTVAISLPSREILLSSYLQLETNVGPSLHLPAFGYLFGSREHAPRSVRGAASPLKLYNMESINLAPNVKGKRNVPKRLQTFHDNAVARGLLSHSAYQAALNLMDPFPDASLDAVGWPSVYQGHTVPSALTKYLKISAPVGTTNSWSFKVLFLPLSSSLSPVNYNTWNRTTGAITAPNAYAGGLGQFNVWTWKDNDPEPDCITTPPTQQIILDINVGFSRSRLCSAGFEVINTSADLYRGGMMYGWRSIEVDEDMTFSPALPSLGLSKSRILSGFPTTLNDIVNLDTTYTGSARNGIGVFSLPGSTANPTAQPLPTTLCITDFRKGVDNLLPIGPTTVLAYDWALCGAYFTGLTPQSNFELKGRIFTEIIPGSSSTSFVQSIARVPVGRSSAFDELINHVLAEMPCAFDYSENPLGEWLHKILGLMAHAVPIIGNLIPHPIAKTIATVATPALAAAARATKPAPAKKQPKRVAAAPSKPAAKRGNRPRANSQ